MNRTVVEEFPKFYDNFHWERPTMLNQTLNQLPLKEVVDQAINDQVKFFPCTESLRRKGARNPASVRVGLMLSLS